MTIPLPEDQSAQEQKQNEREHGERPADQQPALAQVFFSDFLRFGRLGGRFFFAGHERIIDRLFARDRSGRRGEQLRALKI